MVSVGDMDDNNYERNWFLLKRILETIDDYSMDCRSVIDIMEAIQGAT